MKIVDFDAMFEEYVAVFLEKNKDKKSALDLEEVQPKLFEKFANLKIKNIGGKTPSNFYAGYKNNMIEVLKEHIKKGVSINEFLFDALKNEVDEELLIDCLNPIFDEEYLLVIADVLIQKGSKKAINRFIELFFDKKTPASLKDEIIDELKNQIQDIYKKLLEFEPDDDNFLPLLEMLSLVSARDEKITALLRSCLKQTAENFGEILTYIVRYGDESLVKDLIEIYKLEETSDDDKKELLIAIEALGG